MNFLKRVFASCLGVILAFFVFAFLSVVIVSSLMMSGSSSTVGDKVVLSIPLEGVVVDRANENDFASLLNKNHKTLALNDILYAIQNAKTDDRIVGVSLKANALGAGYATAEEIRNALIDFQQSGKFVYAYSGIYTQGAYYVASAADSLFINPEGTLDFSGVSSSMLFFKGFLQKVGVEMQVIRCGAYKSYAESFANDTMSAENREQMEELISSVWNEILEKVAVGRHFNSVDSVAALADQYLSVKPARELVSLNFVDGLLYSDEYERLIRSRIDFDSKEDSPFVDLTTYLEDLDSNASVTYDEGADKVAVVYLSGEIDNGNTDGINSAKTIQMLWDLEKDSTVKSVVLRVNSPGGSAYGSEQICHVVEKLKQKKPVVASFGDYAASGGYYISSNADKIIADRTTITGSIGVIAMVPNAQELADKLGVHYETVKSNPNADLMENAFRPLSESERAAVQTSVDNFYATFLRRCSEGRGVSVEQMHAYAQGRVWSGDDALKINLIDSIGTLTDAINMAASMAHLENYEVAEYPEKRELWEQLEDFPALGYEKLLGKDVFSKEKYIFEKIRNLERIQAIIPYTIELR